ncbi:MAG: AI-2E family transporter [Actinobacteria bacterium]|nr:MAG: AI-2E family transporter [Actinomycetota bacterium]
MLPGDVQERLVRFRASTILAILGMVIAVAILLETIWISRQVLAWILIALFLALALNPAVDWFQRHGVPNRGLASGLTFLVVLIVIAAISALFVPKLVSEVNGFVHKLPDYVDQIAHRRGRLGFLERKYHVTEHVRNAVRQGGASRILGLTGTAIAITKGIITAVVATVTIAFMTFFMLLEGPAWVERFYGLLPQRHRERWRGIGGQIYRTVGGYVTGNLLISVIAGVSSTLVLLALGVPYAVALGLLVGILDLIPLAGATLAAIILAAVAFLHTIVAGIVVIVFFVVYQQIENHILQPYVYSRTVQLSPLAILIAVLIGAELAGILGALAAIPVAGTIQVLLLAWLAERRKHPQAATGTL